MKKLLLLGGTADARRIATQLHTAGIEVIYSIAGLVRTPQIDCEVRVGGFTPLGGLACYLREHAISAVLDVTHPYAARMSGTAVTACAEVGIPCWRFHRPAWQPQPEDRWIELDNWQPLAQQLSGLQRVLLTAGQLDNRLLDAIAAGVAQVHLRTAVQPAGPLPANVHWLKAIGPFSLEAERALMTQLGTEALVSKNSGGESTVAKLAVARERKIPVYMLKRPALPPADMAFSTHQQTVEYVINAWRS